MDARVFVVGSLISMAAAAAGETVTWEAVALRGPGREVVAHGVKTYSPAKDIVVQERKGRSGAISWLKSLLLDDSFALSADVYRAERLDGFGLAIYRREDPNGFSWEWFDRGQGSEFAKRQGSGRVAATLKKTGGYEELSSLTFLDDTVLRYLDDMAKPPGTHTHEVTIRKGSVLRVAP